MLHKFVDLSHQLHPAHPHHRLPVGAARPSRGPDQLQVPGHLCGAVPGQGRGQVRGLAVPHAHRPQVRGGMGY